MPYHVDISPTVTRYLASGTVALTPTQVKRLLRALRGDLADNADHYRADLTRRTAPGSDLFWYRACADPPATLADPGDARLFAFAVNDSNAEQGVLSVEYADELQRRGP